MPIFPLLAADDGQVGSGLKTVRVGWESIPGLEDRLPNGTLSGYNYEYLAKIRQYTNWRLEFVHAPWAEIEAKLVSGEIDIAGDVARTPERLLKYNYADLPNGYSRMIMACRLDDERFGYNDYSSFNGITVATVPSSFRRKLMDREAEKHHFSISYKEYPTEKEMFLALDHGEADVAIFSNVTRYSHYKVLSEWEPNPFYFVVTKGRPDLLEELNTAMRHLEVTDIFIQQRLFRKYFISSSPGVQIAFSRRELDYIATRPELRVLLTKKDIPLCYEKNGKAEGIVVDYLSALAEKTGLRFTYVFCSDSGEMLERFEKGEGDICVDLPDDFMHAEKLNASLTQPFIHLHYGLAMEFNGLDKVRTVALVRGRVFTASKLKELLPAVSFKEYSNMAECMKAVADGEVDAAAVHNVAFDLSSFHARYKKLHFHLTPALDMGLSLGVSNKNGRILFAVLEKAASSMGNIPETIAVKHSLQPHEYDWRDYLSYGTPFLLVILTLLAGIGGLFLWSQRQKKFNLQLEEAKKQADLARMLADRANEAKSTFLSSMSHDLRTPLNGIIGYAELALREITAEKKQDYLQKVKISGNLLLDIVNDVLDLSRIESGKLELKPEPVAESSFWKEIVTAMQPAADLKKIHFHTDFSRYPAQMILVDQLQVKKILINLISNAIKYTPAGGWVEVDIQAPTVPELGCTRRIVVADNGIGMGEDFMKRMFEPFSQEHRPEAANTTGTGLGLSIVKHIVDGMGGKIHVESAPGHGSKFTVDVPVAYQHAEAGRSLDTGPADQQPATLELLAGRRVLLCEDNSMNAEIAKALLGSKGMSVDWASDGQECVEVFSKAAPKCYDLILMDIRMPRMNGILATRAIRHMEREDAKSIPIIAMTADVMPDTIQEAIKAGMDDFVVKPVMPQAMFSTLASHLK